VKSLGPDVVLPLSDGWLQAVKDHTDGRGVDLVVDPIGGETFDDAVRALDTEGRLLVIGFAAGGIPTVKVNRLLLRNVSVVGVGYGEYVNRKPGSQSVFSYGRRRTGQGGLRPRRRSGIRSRRAVRACRASPTGECSARWCWSREREGTRIRCVRHRRRLALQHHSRARRCSADAVGATGLVGHGRRAGVQAMPRRWTACVVATAVDDASTTCTG
jgi:hypothetical protein